MDIKITFVVLLGLSCYAKNAESRIQKRRATVDLPSVLNDIVDWVVSSAKNVTGTGSIGNKTEEWKCGNRTMEHLPEHIKLEVEKELDWMASKIIDPIWLLRFQIFENSIDDYAWKLEMASKGLNELRSAMHSGTNAGTADRLTKLRMMAIIRNFIFSGVNDLKKVLERGMYDTVLARLLPDDVGIPEVVNECTSKLIFIDDPKGKIDCVKGIKFEYNAIVQQAEDLHNEAKYYYDNAYISYKDDFHKAYANFLSHTEEDGLFSRAANFIRSFKRNQPGYLSIIIAGKFAEEPCIDCPELIEQGNLRNEIKHFKGSK